MGRIKANDDLIGLNKFPKSVRDQVIAVRKLAREIINDLEPSHISTYSGLEVRIIAALQKVRVRIRMKNFQNEIGKK